MSSDNVKIAAVERALAVLDAFTTADRYVTLADLARRTRVSKATLLRILQSLIEHGLVIRAEDGRYYIGPASLRLASIHNETARSGRTIIPTLNHLTAKTGETASYSIRQRDFLVYIYRSNSFHRLRAHIQPGDMSPVDKCAPGRVILAFESPPDPKYAKLRDQMIAISRGEFEEGIVTIACPVFNNEGRVVGAISLSGPQSRMDGDRMPSHIDDLQQSALNITSDFGGRADLYAALQSNTKTKR